MNLVIEIKFFENFECANDIFNVKACVGVERIEDLKEMMGKLDPSIITSCPRLD